MKCFEVKSIHRSRLEITKLLVLLLALGGVASNLYAKPVVKAKSKKSLSNLKLTNCVANETADSNGVCVPTVVPAGCILNGAAGAAGIYQNMTPNTWKTPTPTLTQFMGSSPTGTVSTGQPYWGYLTAANSQGLTALMSAVAEGNFELAASIRVCENSQNYLQNQVSNEPDSGILNWTAKDWAASLATNPSYSSPSGQQLVSNLLTILGGTALSAIGGDCAFDSDCHYGLICSCINGASKSVPPASGFCKLATGAASGSQVGQCIAAPCTVGGQVPPNYSQCCAGSINTNNAGKQVCVSNEGGTCTDTTASTDCLQGLQCIDNACQAVYCPAGNPPVNSCSLAGAICGQGTLRCCVPGPQDKFSQGGACTASSQCCTRSEYGSGDNNVICAWGGAQGNTCQQDDGSGINVSVEEATDLVGGAGGSFIFLIIGWKMYKAWKAKSGEIVAKRIQRFGRTRIVRILKNLETAVGSPEATKPGLVFIYYYDDETNILYKRQATPEELAEILKASAGSPGDGPPLATSKSAALRATSIARAKGITAMEDAC